MERRSTTTQMRAENWWRRDNETPVTDSRLARGASDESHRGVVRLLDSCAGYRTLERHATFIQCMLHTMNYRTKRPRMRTILTFGVGATLAITQLGAGCVPAGNSFCDTDGASSNGNECARAPSDAATEGGDAK
jgi:hypothetical protein